MGGKASERLSVASWDMSTLSLACFSVRDGYVWLPCPYFVFVCIQHETVLPLSHTRSFLILYICHNSLVFSVTLVRQNG